MEKGSSANVDLNSLYYRDLFRNHGIEVGMELALMKGQDYLYREIDRIVKRRGEFLAIKHFDTLYGYKHSIGIGFKLSDLR